MPKILTCNYCGARSALVLDRGRHELVCASCGAPLHEIKQMPASQRVERDIPRSKPEKKLKKRKPKKKRFAKILSEVWDELEDIFD